MSFGMLCWTSKLDNFDFIDLMVTFAKLRAREPHSESGLLSDGNNQSLTIAKCRLN